MFNQIDVESSPCKQSAAEGSHKPKEPFESCHLSPPCFVHRIDFGSISRVDGVAANLAVGGEQPALRSKLIADNGEISDLPVMRKFGIHGTQRRLNGCRFDFAAHERGEIAAPVTDHHNMLRRGKEAGDFFLDRFGLDVMAGIQDYQVFDAGTDAPIPANVDFALIASVEPSALQGAGSLFRAVPVARENMRPA